MELKPIFEKDLLGVTQYKWMCLLHPELTMMCEEEMHKKYGQDLLNSLTEYFIKAGRFEDLGTVCSYFYVNKQDKLVYIRSDEDSTNVVLAEFNYRLWSGTIYASSLNGSARFLEGEWIIYEDGKELDLDALVDDIDDHEEAEATLKNEVVSILHRLGFDFFLEK